MYANKNLGFVPLTFGAAAPSGGTQQISTTEDTCRSMGGTFQPNSYTYGANRAGYCFVPVAAPYRAPPPPPPPQQQIFTPTITVSPAIQTTVSPQVSPVFQQAFQPTNSPQTAGTTQIAPAISTADTSVKEASPPSPVPSGNGPSNNGSPVQPVSPTSFAPPISSPAPYGGNIPQYSEALYSSSGASGNTPTVNVTQGNLLRSPWLLGILAASVLGGAFLLSKKGRRK